MQKILAQMLFHALLSVDLMYFHFQGIWIHEGLILVMSYSLSQLDFFLNLDEQNDGRDGKMG